jgi:transcriptional regulator with XRE-family HTH domain
MAARKGFFTVEMGSWLREIRTQAGLTQDDVAARMGLSGKGRKSVVSNLEAGLVPNPYFSTIIFYMLACGTPVGRFCDRFNTLGLVQVDPGTFEDTEFDAEVKQRLRVQTSSQVDKFQRRIRFPRRGRRLPPEELKQRAEKYLFYQTQVKTVQQAVKVLLSRTNVPVTEIHAYLNYARVVLSAMRKHKEPDLPDALRRASGNIEVNGLDPDIGRRIEQLVVRIFRKPQKQSL